MRINARVHIGPDELRRLSRPRASRRRSTAGHGDDLNAQFSPQPARSHASVSRDRHVQPARGHVILVESLPRPPPASCHPMFSTRFSLAASSFFCASLWTAILLAEDWPRWGGREIATWSPAKRTARNVRARRKRAQGTRHRHGDHAERQVGRPAGHADLRQHRPWPMAGCSSAPTTMTATTRGSVHPRRHW